MEDMPPRSDQFREPVRAVFDPQTGFVVVQLSKAEYGYHHHPVTYRGRAFEPKDELHITVVSAEAAEMLRAFLERSTDNAVSVQEIVDETRWVFRELDTFYHVVEEPGVETIIQMVELPYMADFFSRLSGLVGQGFMLPPAHVTLYTLGTETGIGLPNNTLFEQRVQHPIRPEEIFPAGDAMDDRFA